MGDQRVFAPGGKIFDSQPRLSVFKFQKWKLAPALHRQTTKSKPILRARNT